MLEPCSPGERNAIAVTLTELAEKGMAAQARCRVCASAAACCVDDGISTHRDVWRHRCIRRRYQ